ncbi:PH domain-containing protein [Homarus americanus]|uniref:PH domain-containing protein n=1 Tax=Homarus americanus TaxID=6706 RepID=A0A8J5JQY6_HOMAM|nr:PH domain-containing protein [Homarus americanus]
MALRSPTRTERASSSDTDANMARFALESRHNGIQGLVWREDITTKEDRRLSCRLREIYSPSRDHARWPGDTETNGEKPPTPPLHRFPSWESRIYQVAQEGLSGSGVVATTGEAASRMRSSGLGSYPEIHVPVYAAVKGRASQIRSVPFTGDSSDSSDGEDHCGGSDSRGLSSHTPSSSAESSSSSPSKSKTSSLSPAKLSGSSPSKSMRRDSSRLSQESADYADYAIPPDAMPDSIPDAIPTLKLPDTSFESGVSDDYAIPPDARSDSGSLESTMAPTLSARTSCVETTTNTLTSSHIGTVSPRRESSLEKMGYLTKLGGKLKTWKKRYFVLKDGTLTYWKSQTTGKNFAAPTARAPVHLSADLNFQVRKRATNQLSRLVKKSVHETESRSEGDDKDHDVEDELFQALYETAHRNEKSDLFKCFLGEKPSKKL